MASLALAIAALAPLTLVAAPLLMWPRLGTWFEALRPRRAIRYGVGGGALAASAVLFHIDATAYVRLYLSLHLGLALVTLGTAVVGAALLWPASPQSASTDRRRRAVLALLVVVWMAAFATSLERIMTSPVRRALAVEQTTWVSHGLLALHAMWGILTPSEQEFDAIATERANALLTPQPREPLTPPPLPRTNLLLVTVDAMRWDRIPTGGAIAEIAREGVAFERAYAPSCWTIHSMTAMLRSRLPSQLSFTMVSVDRTLRMTPRAADDELVTNPVHWKKVTPTPWDDETPGLAGWLGAAGWDTATAIAYVFYRPAAGVTRHFSRVDDRPYIEHNIDNEGITSAALTDAAIDLVNRRDANRPLFLWLHYMDPHAPYVAQDALAAGGDALARYDSELRLVDRELGRLVDFLRVQGLWDDTIVVIHSDHGEEFREHGGQFHATTVYEEQVRVPLFVRLPPRANAAPGTRQTAVSLLDVAPTVADLVGVAPDAPMVGRSFARALFGGEPEARPVLSECTRFGRDRRAVIDGNHKLIVDRSIGTLELYDLAADPMERKNLVEAQPQRVRELLPLVALPR